eukprot:665514-Alexandrium_andersonii.AAC.1
MCIRDRLCSRRIFCGRATPARPCPQPYARASSSAQPCHQRGRQRRSAPACRMSGRWRPLS